MKFTRKKKNNENKELEDQGQWKTLWEEANKTAQEKDQQISTFVSTIRRFKNF